MKRCVAAVVLMIFVWLFSTALGEALSLLPNGGFEELDASGNPVGWYQMAYRSQAGYSRMVVTDEAAHSGYHSAVVENASKNDARFVCTVAVKPASLYKLSGYVLVEHMEDTGNGANFGVEGMYSFSDCLYDTNGEWEYLEWFGETGEKQTELTLGVRVGGYSAESVGKAYFDDVVLQQVDELPIGIIADLWYNASPAPEGKSTSNVNDAKKSTALFVAVALLFALIVWAFFPIQNKGHKSRVFVVVLFAFALLVRVILAMRIPGYQVDINCFTAWSLRMAQNGPAGFYAADYFCDYPPGAMLLLWPVGLLMQGVGMQNIGVQLLIIKSLPILFDMLGGWLLYRYLLRKCIGPMQAALLSAFYLFNPLVLVNGAAWGQMDSTFTLILLLVVLFALSKRWQYAMPSFALAALVKPQALLFAPIGFFWLVRDVVKRKQEWKALRRQIALGFAMALATAFVIVLPFSANQSWDWVFKLYGETLSSYPYATINTANLYYLLGANWTGLEEMVSVWIPVASALLFLAMGIWLRRKGTEKRPLCWLMTAMAAAYIVLAITGASYAMYGYSMMVFIYLFVMLQGGSLPFTMALALSGIYVLGIKVHERYLFPALLLLLVAYGETRDRRLLGLYVGFSVTTFINTAIVLDNSILFGAAQGHLNPDTLVLNCAICICNLLLFVYAAWVGLTGLRESQNKESTQANPEKRGTQKEQSYRNLLLNPRDCRLHITRRDFAFLTSVTVAYAMLALTNLGSTVAPQTGWVSTGAEEEVVFELEEAQPFSLLYYAGVSYDDFSISVSEDGDSWSKAYPCEMREGLCYRWNYAVNATEDEDGVTYGKDVLKLNGRYLRINAENPGLNLWEVVVRSESGKHIALRLHSHTGENSALLTESKPASQLIDENQTCIGEPGWFNGTYFDEIYHARTAYEHLHGQVPYETTHPPLGKLLMSAAIAVFGMTPFGWRFAGAFIGILMLPALYLLALQLTHKKSIAAVSMLAFSLDLMHFTQTRIATIDSFPVFFILMSYVFMIRYMQTDFFAAGQGELLDKTFLKTMLPLLLSGICMGLSIASKWIGLYSAVGLAVLFFITQYRVYRTSHVARDVEAQNDAEQTRIETAKEMAFARIWVTCGFCVLFFVIVPAVIYYLSYIPYLSPTGNVTLKRVFDAQVGMLRYHSTPGLGMDHPFQSPWWQWPFILKPMWFVQDQYEPSGYASTILCFGNPWVFYIGAIAMAALLMACLCKYVRVREGQISLSPGDGNLELVTVAIAFFAQYLPWVFVPRSMYIYHYFASVPFIILATAWWMDKLTAGKQKLRNAVWAVYILGALIFFVVFFPYASGVLTSTRWLDAMKWFSRLYY